MQNIGLHKILFDCERMKYPHTGLYEFCLQLGRSLVQNAAENEKISFYLHPKTGRPFGNISDYFDQNSLHKFAMPSLRGYQIWHSTFQGTMYWPQSQKIKKVLTIHDLNFLYEHTNRLKKIKRSLSKLQSLVDKADTISVISNYVKEDVARHFNIGNKIVNVIPNGCSLTRLPHLIDPKLKPAKPFLFTIGAVIPKKNFHVLPSLVAGTDRQLIMAGVIPQEDYKNKIIEEAKRFGVESQVFFAGAISENDKQWYYEHCEAFLFPSIAEGFGLPVVEAMSFGKPVFLSTATSLPETGGNEAYYFKSFDPDNMREIFIKGMQHFRENDPSESLRKRALSFNWNNAAMKYLDVYRSLY